ncbi:uncharacterized protein TNCV_1151721 [Trichonephila clavipes]|nr:uncharacterized protein TNCV_1151721 [Trichonephila clavipes]
MGWIVAFSGSPLYASTTVIPRRQKNDSSMNHTGLHSMVQVGTDPPAPEAPDVHLSDHFLFSAHIDLPESIMLHNDGWHSRCALYELLLKPSEYFNSEDNEYMDKFYSDYEYSTENEKPPYKLPTRQAQSYYPNLKGVGAPLGLVLSASDPDGSFSKTKDLLKGASYGKPSS